MSFFLSSAVSLLALAPAAAAPEGGPTTEPVAAASATVLRFERPERLGLSVITNETHDLVLQSLTTQFGDADPIEQPTAMRLRTRTQVAAVDEVDGPTRLRRRFLDAEGTIQVMDPAAVDEAAGTWQGVEFSLKSPFPGVSVAFTPVPGQPGGFGRHYDSTALRESLLPRLATPTDWSTLLPAVDSDGAPRALELGDTWELPIASLEPLLAPSGFMGWRAAEEGADEQVLRAFASGVGGNLHLAFDGDAEGDVTARLETVGVEGDDGRYAEIRVKFDIAMRGDRDEFVDDRRMESEGELDVDVIGALLVIGLEGEATIRWSLELDRPLRAIVAARESVEMTVRVLPENGQVVTQTIAMRGSLANSVKVSNVPLAPSKREAVEPPR